MSFRRRSNDDFDDAPAVPFTGAETEEAYRAVVENAPDAFIIVNRTGEMVLVNAQVERLFGYTKRELLHQPVEMLIPERLSKEHVRHRIGYAAMTYHRSMGAGHNLIGRRKDGSEFPVDISLSPVTVANRPLYAAAIRDVSDVKNAERERERLAAFPERNPLPVLECDKRGRITYANPAADRMLSEMPAHLYRTLDEQLFPGFQETVRRCIEEGIEVRDKETQRGGSTFLWSVHGVPELKRAHIYAMDISARKRAEEELRAQSLLDDLTGLYNRRGFLSIGGQQWKLSQRNRQPVALLYIDLDNLKSINDTLGHLEGDRALIETAEVLRETFRRSDVIGRLGGDEFAALPVYAMEEGVDDLLARLQESVDVRNNQPGREFELSLSTGVAQCQPGEEMSLTDLIAMADADMYARKRDRKDNGSEISPAAPRRNN